MALVALAVAKLAIAAALHPADLVWVGKWHDVHSDVAGLADDRLVCTTPFRGAVEGRCTACHAGADFNRFTFRPTSTSNRTRSPSIGKKASATPTTALLAIATPIARQAKAARIRTDLGKGRPSRMRPDCRPVQVRNAPMLRALILSCSLLADHAFAETTALTRAQDRYLAAASVSSNRPEVTFLGWQVSGRTAVKVAAIAPQVVQNQRRQALAHQARAIPVGVSGHLGAGGIEVRPDADACGRIVVPGSGGRVRR